MPYSERRWFDYDGGIKPEPEEIRGFLDSPDCPLNGFIGNKGAVDLIKSVAFFAWGNNNHAIVNRSTGKDEKINIALLGDAGLGKTTLAKLFAKTVILPFIELHKVSKVQEIFDKINKDLTPYGTPISVYNGKYKCPPCILFIDEVHQYMGKSRRSPSGIMNDLLKATEPDDAVLTDGEWVLNCSNICWVVATTHWHLLPSPFRSRFMEVKLKPYSLENVAQIVKARFPEIPAGVCVLAAKYGCLIPRQAINFAKMFGYEQGYKGVSWEQAAENVASMKGIDEWGMTSERRQVIALLAKYGTLSKDKLILHMKLDEIELSEMVLPPLISPAIGEPLIQHGHRGWSLLPAGVKELKKRGIPRVHTGSI